MYRGEKNQKRKKRYDYRPPYSKMFYKQKEYKSDQINSIEPEDSYYDSYKPKYSYREITLNDSNKENENTSNQANDSFAILNLTAEMVKEAYFFPKKSQSIKELGRYHSHSSDQETIASSNHNEETQSRNSVNNTTYEESASNYEQQTTAETKRKISNKSINGSSPMVSEFTIDEPAMENNQEQQPLTKQLSGKMPKVLPPLIETEQLSFEQADEGIKKASTMKGSMNKYNTITRLNQIIQQQQQRQMQMRTYEDNTDILCVNVTVNNGEVLVFKLKRFDDLFKTVKLFCEINKIDERLIKPLIIKSLEALNQVYQVINHTMENEEQKYLEFIKMQYVMSN